MSPRLKIAKARSANISLIGAICRRFLCALAEEPRDYASAPDRTDLLVTRETDPVADERTRTRERERSVIAHHSSLAHRSRRFVLVLWQPENRFSLPLEFQAFARKRIPPIKKENRAVRWGRSRTRVTDLSVRADVTIGRLFLATSPAPTMLGRRKAEASRASHTWERARPWRIIVSHYCFRIYRCVMRERD